MRKRSKGFAFARNTDSPLKMSGVIAQPARPRSTAAELDTSQPCFTKKFNQPSRPSGVVSYVTPVRPPPCHNRSGTAPRRFAGRKYCTYIASTEYVPFGSTFAGTPPGVNTTSFTGLPEISTSRPPTWNEPMSRSAIGAWAQAETIRTRELRIARTVGPSFELLGFARQILQPLYFPCTRGRIRNASLERFLRARDFVLQLVEAMREIEDLAPALIAGAEARLQRAHGGVAVSRAAVRIAALVGAESLEALV